MAIVRSQVTKTFVFTILCLPITVFSQTGPGGIGATGAATSLVFWLDSKRVNADDSNPAVGAAVTSWSDKSGRGKTVTQNTTGVATYASGGVTFNDIGYLSANDSGFPTGSSARSAIVVASTPSTATDDVLFFYGTGTDNRSYGILKIMNTNTTAPNGIRNFFFNDDFDIPGGWTPANTTKMALCTLTGTTQKVYVNNNTADTKTTGNPNTSLGGTNALQIGGWTTYPLYSSATISEIIFYNKVLNAAEQIIISNYLSAKYNFTLAASDLYTNDNTTNGDYDYDVAGIGQASTGVNQLDSKGTGIVEISGATGLGNGEYYFWGHDGASMWASTTDIPTGVQARIQRVWRGQMIGTITNFDVTFDLSDYPTSTAGDLVLLVDTNNNGVFSDETPITGATGSGTSFTFNNVTAMTGTRRFTLGTKNKSQTPLPIVLESFQAEQVVNTVEVAWQTASEMNNDFFTLERSADGHAFETITTMKAAGNSKEERSYKFMDLNPYEGLSYYRLSQTDFDGDKKQFNPVSVNFSRENAAYKIFPNPVADDRFFVYIPGTESGNSIQVSVEELNGKQLIASGCDCLTPGQDNSYEVVLPHPLAHGLYLVKVNYGNEQHVLKLVAQ